MQSIKAARRDGVHPILSVLNVRKPVIYSLDSSAEVFKIFLESLDYTKENKRQLQYLAPKTHKMFPSLEWLQKQVEEIGIIRTGQGIARNSAKGTTYLHFLAIVGILSINYKDYFYTNPRTILKLDKWIEPYKQMLGIVEFVEELLKISESTANRHINKERQKKFGNKVAIYLVLRYQLKCIKDLQFEQWQEFMLDCRGSRRYIQNASISLMHQTLLHMGIVEVLYDKKLSGCINQEKERKWCSQSMIAPYYASFMNFINQSKAKETWAHYRESIMVFYNYLIKTKGEQFSFDRIKRADIVGFVNYLYTCRNKQGNPCSRKWIESRSYCVKVFLRFISENVADFKSRGILVFSKKVIVDHDFSIDQIKYLPKPIAEDVLNALLENLNQVQNIKYRLAFLLMLTTGLSKSDMLSLKYDCLKYDETKDVYFLSYYRLKTKKHISVQALPDTIPIVKELQRMNTQEILLPHPDGSNVIFLLNDGGKILTSSWLSYSMKKHKEATTNQAPHLACNIKKLTPHRIRHTFATIMRDRGATITQLMELLGHNNISVTQKYTKESDRMKIELIEKLQRGQYICESLQSMEQPILQGEQGTAFIQSMLKHENRFIGGRCTVNGFDNCKNAYRCLTCSYLCTTIEDMPEIISIIKMQHLQYQELSSRLEREVDEKILKSIEKDIKRIGYSLKRGFEKYKNLHAIATNKEQHILSSSIVPQSIERSSIITFV